MHGIEIKCSRSDWVKELRSPNKSAPIQKYCDRWWIVVGDENIVHKGELPPTWGLMIPSPRGAKLVVKTQAPKLEAVELDRGFIASMLRRASEQIERANTGKESEHYKKGYAEGKREEASKKDSTNFYLKQDLERLRGDVKEFEEASGVRIQRYRGTQIGDAVRTVLAHQQANHGGRRTQLRRAIETFESQLKAMKTMEQCLDLLDKADLASVDPPTG